MAKNFNPQEIYLSQAQAKATAAAINKMRLNGWHIEDRRYTNQKQLAMTTYYDKDSQLRYFYDPNFKLWIIYKIDEQGNQVTNADYAANKAQLKQQYPFLTFKKEE